MIKKTSFFKIPFLRKFRVVLLIAAVILILSFPALPGCTYKESKKTSTPAKQESEQKEAEPKAEQPSTETAPTPISGPEKPDAMFGANLQHTGVYNTKGVPKLNGLKWKFYASRPIDTCPAVVDGIVYFPSTYRYFFAVNAELGSEVWRFNAGDTVINNSPAVSDGTVYFGCENGYFYALDIYTGKEKWHSKIINPSTYEHGKIQSSPAVTNGIVYFGCSDGYLYALNAKSGEEIWKFRTGGEIDSSPAVFDGLVYFGSEDKYFYAVDCKTGEPVWDFKTDGLISYSPAISNGTVFLEAIMLIALSITFMPWTARPVKKNGR